LDGRSKLGRVQSAAEYILQGGEYSRTLVGLHREYFEEARYVRKDRAFCRVQQTAFHFFARASFCERLKDFTEYSKRDADDLLSDAVNETSLAGR